MKTTIIAILALSLLSFAGCGSQENTSKSDVKPPGISSHMAAIQGNLDATKQHIKAGSDLNEIDAYGSTPLTIAITFGKTEVAKALIEAGADLKIPNKEGSNPLHLAAFFCHTEIVKVLLDNGADKNALSKTGSTAHQIVTAPFEVIKPIYAGIEKSLKPLGFKLDYERIIATRPIIAEILDPN